MSEIGNEYPYFNANEAIEEENSVQINQIISDNGVGVTEEITTEATEIVPEVGMKFTSYDEAFEFYMQYAYKVGFSVRKRNSKKGPDGNLTNATFACSREGKRIGGGSISLNPHPTMQTGCKAKMTICSDILGTWRVTKLHLEHNHRTSPSKSRLYRCNRQLNDHVKRKLDVNDKLCRSFKKMANLLADDESRTDELMAWIDNHMKDLSVGKSSNGSNQVGSKGGTIDETPSTQILDPQRTKTKGAPWKLRKKGPLEKSSKRTKGSSKTTKGKTPIQNNDKDTPPTYQPTHEPGIHVFNPFGYSGQLMVPPINQWGGAYGGNWTTPYGANQQLMTMYSSQAYGANSNAWEFNSET